MEYTVTERIVYDRKGRKCRLIERVPIMADEHRHQEEQKACQAYGDFIIPKVESLWNAGKKKEAQELFNRSGFIGKIDRKEKTA